MSTIRVRGGSSGEDGRNGVLRVYNVTLKRCIRYAYSMAEDQILGGPKWIDVLRYDIVAKADRPADEHELLTMLRSPQDGQLDEAPHDAAGF